MDDGINRDLVLAPKYAFRFGRAPWALIIAAVNLESLRLHNLWWMIPKSRRYYRLGCPVPALWCDAVTPRKSEILIAKAKEMNDENFDGAHVA